jgi:RNA polymerase sigma factor (sigma-70 family)
MTDGNVNYPGPKCPCDRRVRVLPQRISAPGCLYVRAQHSEVMTNLLAVAEGKRGMQKAPATGSVRADRREEFGRLAAAELSASYQLATRILGNRGEAEDAVNEAALKAWTSFDRLRDTASFRSWFIRIVVNTCRNELRHRKVVRTRLADGRVLIAGGNTHSRRLVEAELYDPATGAFTQAGFMNVPRADHTATLLEDGRVLIAGGEVYVGPGSARSAEIYDPTSGNFSPTGSLTGVRVNHVAVLLGDGTVLLAGGIGENGFLATAELSTPDRANSPRSGT